MAQWKEKASQGSRDLVIARVQFLWAIDDPPIDLDAGPSMQWYPERWMSDSHVQLMRWEVRAMHHHLIQIAWKDSRPPGSIASIEDFQLHCGDPPADTWPQIWRILSRSWIKSSDGRVWQPGTCRAYLAQIVGRLRRARAAASKHQNETLKLQCLALENALQGSKSALQHTGDALQHTGDALQVSRAGAGAGPRDRARSPSPSPSPSPVPTELEESPTDSCASGDARATVDADFEMIWKEYPNKIGKAKARAAWERLGAKRPEPKLVLEVIEAAKVSPGWARDNGRFIPHGSTFFSQRRWEDGVEAYREDRSSSRGVHVKRADRATQELRNRRARGQDDRVWGEEIQEVPAEEILG